MLKILLFLLLMCSESIEFLLFLHQSSHTSRPPCLFSVFHVALASRTLISWKKRGKLPISSVFGILKWDKRRVPSNQHKQWHSDLFVCGNNAHFSLPISITRVHETAWVNTWGFRCFVIEIVVLCRLPREFWRINRLWKISKISCDNMNIFMFTGANFDAGKQFGFIISWHQSGPSTPLCVLCSHITCEQSLFDLPRSVGKRKRLCSQGSLHKDTS